MDTKHGTVATFCWELPSIKLYNPLKGGNARLSDKPNLLNLSYHKGNQTL